MTLLRSKIEKSIPRKRAGASGHDKALATFFDRIVEALLRNVDFAKVKCVLVASPGFTREVRIFAAPEVVLLPHC